MSFVASSDRVRAFEEFSSKSSFSQEAIVIDFTTTPEYVRSALPPGLEPGDTPTGHILMSTMESKICGEFDCALMSLDVKFRGKPGTFMLDIIISNDLPVTWTARSGARRRKWVHAVSGDLETGGMLMLIAMASVSSRQAKFGEDLPPRVRPRGRAYARTTLAVG